MRLSVSNASPTVPSTITSLLFYCRSITLPLQHNNVTLIVLTAATAPRFPSMINKLYFIAAASPFHCSTTTRPSLFRRLPQHQVTPAPFLCSSYCLRVVCFPEVSSSQGGIFQVVFLSGNNSYFCFISAEQFHSILLWACETRISVQISNWAPDSAKAGLRV